MDRPYETCEYGYEWFFTRWNLHHMSDEEWNDWYNDHCARCQYFSGYHCTLGD